MIEICLCYAPEDDKLRQALEKHLRVLQRQNLLIALWSSYDISAGEERRLEIEKHLDTAHIILLLLSPDFLASDDFYQREVMRAIQRYERGEARVIPILFRPVHWHDTPLGKLQALPENGKPVTDRSWHSLDEALFEVADYIHKVVEDLSFGSPTSLASPPTREVNLKESRLERTRDDTGFAVVQTFLDHLGPVACVLFTPDGETLVSDSWDHTIKYWNLRTGAKQTLTGHSGPIYSIAQNLNKSSELSSGGDDSLIRLWHFQTGGPMVSLSGHSGPISSVAFSPDGSMLASGSYDTTIKFWNANGSELFTLIGHAGPVSSVFFSPDGTTLASASHDCTIKLWDLRTGQEQKTLLGHSGPVSSVAFSPNGRTLISGSYDKTIKEWDYVTGQVLATYAEHSAAVLCVAFHPSRQLFASGSLDKTIKIWEKQPRNPYKSLRPFTSSDAQDFFGRDALVEELTERLERILQADKRVQYGRLLSVIGASGSGKSSVVMAGLLPHLRAGALPESDKWIYLTPMVPGAHPIESLAIVLAYERAEESVKTIYDDLVAEGERGLYCQAFKLMKAPSGKIVLVVDQFEELFTHPSEKERQHFIDLLVTAVTEPQSPVIVIVTLRAADFYEQLMNYPQLMKLIEAQNVSIPAMDIDELRTVIEKPAALHDVQLSFEPGLVGDLLFEVRGQPGALPLLEFILDQLFQRRRTQQFTRQAYQEIGGVKGALSKRAEETYATLPSEQHRQMARILFLRLISFDIYEDITCRHAALDELDLPDTTQAKIIRETAQAFIDARVLITSVLTSIAIFEVSHDVLLEWERLSRWVREAREDIPMQQRIRSDAIEWLRNGRPADRLYRGKVLVEALQWANRNIPNVQEMAFLNASAAQRSIWARFARWLNGDT